MNALRYTIILAALVILTGCSTSATSQSSSTTGSPATIFLSVTSDANQSPQSVDMAMKFAGLSLDEDRPVVMFFNVKGVTIPKADLPDQLAFQDNSPLKEQLIALIERGVDVHVCPICMKALGVEESDLIEGAKVTTRPSLFANIGSNTVVFTY